MFRAESCFVSLMGMTSMDHAEQESELKQNHVKISSISITFIDTEAKSNYLRDKK